MDLVQYGRSTALGGYHMRELLGGGTYSLPVTVHYGDDADEGLAADVY